MSDAMQGINTVINSNTQHISTNTRATSTTDTTLSLTNVFNLTDRLQIFSYLVSSNRVRWYRVIMRFFFQCHRELYRYQLTAQEVRDAVRDAFDSEYTLEQCQNDLNALKEWGNISTIYDSNRATSIASFLSPALLYQATSETIAIETFLDEQMRLNAGKGALRQGDLPRLWTILQSLDEALQHLSAELTSIQGREIAEEWQRAFEIWNTMAREAAQYLANMVNASRQGHLDLAAYQLYKAAVVAYVHGFAQALTLYSRRIRELLTAWASNGKLATLIDIVAYYLEPPSADTESRPSQEELLEEAHNQLDALRNWFAAGKNADSFRRNALAEVDKVVRQATVLASSARPNANYATSLNTLARLLLLTQNGDTAQQIFSAAFAHTLPVHLTETLAGSPSAAYEAERQSAWQEAPTVSLYLRPVSRAFRGEHAFEDPVIDNRTLIRTMIEQQEERLREQRERFNHLFATEYLDIGTLPQITIEERAILTEVIDSCLGHSSHTYNAPDGSVIVLLNPREGAYAFLRASDGTLILPRYRLQRQFATAESRMNVSISEESQQEQIDNTHDD